MRSVSERLQKLTKMLEREPNDPFLIYGLALEHKKLGNVQEAIKLLDRVITLDPGYCYAYYQKGMTFESSGDTNAAKQKGDAHAQEEIEAALSMIE